MVRIQSSWSLIIVVLCCLRVSVVPGKLWEQQSHTGEPPSSVVLTQAKDIFELPLDEAGQGLPLRVRGVITFYDGPSYHPDHSDPNFFFQDSTGGIYVRQGSTQELNLKSGDLVEIKGVTGHGWFKNQIEKPEVQIVGRAPMPEPRRPRLDQLELGRQDSRWVEITGDVHSIQVEEPSKKLILILSVGSENLKAWVLNYPKSARTDLLHSKVRIQGVCGGVYNSKREMIGIIIYVPDMNSVTNMGASSRLQ